MAERARAAFVRSAKVPRRAHDKVAATAAATAAATEPAVAAPRLASGGIRPGGAEVFVNTPPGLAGSGAGCNLGPGRRGEASPCPGLGLPSVTAHSGCGAPPSSALGKFALYIENVRGNTPLGQMAPHLIDNAVRDGRHRACLSRFRCSCHDLRIERDRYLPAAVKPARQHRTCLVCASDEVEDEHHFIFTCPLYHSLRFDYADLFSTDCHTVACFLSKNQDRVAKYIYTCTDLRRSATQMSLAGSE